MAGQKKICPWLRTCCIEEACMLWDEEFGGCFTLSHFQSVRFMTMVSDEGVEELSVPSIKKQ